MGECDHQLPVFDGDESDPPAQAGRKQFQVGLIAAMPGEGAKSMKRSERTEQRLGGFHGAIIASWLFALSLAGCGYKTDPVYLPPVEHNVTQATAGIR